MRTIAARICASLLIVLLMAPAAVAQDDAMAESAEKAKHHIHHGTMTPPGAPAAMDITYEISMADGEHSGWIVANANGQEMRIEMMDLAMDAEAVTYHWTTPGGEMIITCELAAADEGGWAGECTDNEEGAVGLMSMAPMSMDHEADHKGDHDEGHDAGHDEGHDDHDDHDDSDDYDDEDADEGEDDD